MIKNVLSSKKNLLENYSKYEIPLFLPLRYFFFMVFCTGGISLLAQSAYISKVFEYMPAPGQFVNELPEYEQGDTKNDMRLKAEESIADNEQILISLGGYGGYIVFGFDHMIPNVVGEYDFKILGNAFYAGSQSNADGVAEGGSSEPGIVMVSYDANGNGQPDDAWYELAGSEYHKQETLKNYQITYYKPDENKIPTPNTNYPYLTDTTYVRWETNQGEQGYISRTVYHQQSYYPLWITDTELIFKGTKLPNNYVDESGNGSYYVLYAYGWGYADNHSNNDERSNFKIDWAVDSLGNLVVLPGIHFVKVYTGVNQYCGWLGETSTEIMGAYDLHLLNASYLNTTEANPTFCILTTSVNETLLITAQQAQTIDIYNLYGKNILTTAIQAGTNSINCTYLPTGLYLVKAAHTSSKFIKR